MIANGIALILVFVTATILFLYKEPTYLYLDLITKEELHDKYGFLRRMREGCTITLAVSVAFLSVRLFMYLLDNFSRPVQIAFASFGYFLLLCFFGALFSAVAMLGLKYMGTLSDYMRVHYLPKS